MVMLEFHGTITRVIITLNWKKFEVSGRCLSFFHTWQ